jgi:hypothetical protein
MPVTGIVSISPSFGAGVNAAFAIAELARVIRTDVSLAPFLGDREGGCARGVR